MFNFAIVFFKMCCISKKKIKNKDEENVILKLDRILDIPKMHKEKRVQICIQCRVWDKQKPN